MRRNSFKWIARTWSSFASELNFFRIHVLFFTVAPLILAAIFYAANGRYHISYIDALFNGISSITCCGLATVNLSSMTGFQQFLLFLQFNIGNTTFISWFVIFFRRQYFKRELRHVLMAETARKASQKSPIAEYAKNRSWSRRMLSVFRPRLSVVEEENAERKTDRDVEGKLRTDMIRRIDDAPKPINPSGKVVDKVPPRRISNDVSAGRNENLDTANSDLPSRSLSSVESLVSDVGPTNGAVPNASTEAPTGGASRIPHTFPRHQTIEFAPSPLRRRESESQSTAGDPSPMNLRSIHRSSLRRYNTQNSTQTQRSRLTEATTSPRDRGFGGFPMPFSLLNSIVSKIFPRLKRHLSRTVTMPATTSLVSTHTAQRTPPNSKAVPYISFNTTVGPNSEFKNLTNQQLEELGGLEYRALNVLLWIVGAYFIGFQVLGAIITMPYMYRHRWRSAFEPPALVRSVTPGWFTVYQMSSSFTNTGNSLVDQSMIPFQEAYLLVIVQWILILVGNSIYPCLLRFIIWSMAKLVTRGSQLNETLHFLLDHPRRCYIYLFQSHQTWFLVAATVFFTSLEWFFFLLLDIGNAAIEAIPLNVRFSSGLFQAVATRAAGFAIFSLADVAPAVQILYLVMMYITIFPIALSVRATNVYEERALGIYEDENEDVDYSFDDTGPSRVNIWGRYFAHHIRIQLAFDMWWLVITTFLICIIERHNINDTDRPWFNVFSIIFETVSAYGPVGLSLGIQGENYSLSGSFSTLSKLIICVTMLRGRHRNLPFALDRSIMLPTEFLKTNERDTTSNDAPVQRPFASGTGSLYPIDDNDTNGDAQLHRRSVTRQESIVSGSDSGSSRQNASNVRDTAEG